MKILVTGATGMLGQDLCPVLEDEGYEVIETASHNLDVTDTVRVSSFVEEEKPGFIIHCAAIVDPDKVEENPEKAFLVNETGTKNLALAAAKAEIPILYISTDYVFDGTKTGKYSPEDIPNPVNKYGLSKLKGEEAVKSVCTKFYIVRTGILYGRHGNNFIEALIEQSKTNSEIKVISDQKGCPTWTVDLSEAIAELISSEDDWGIYHLAASGGCSRYELAKEVFKILGIKIKLIPITLAEANKPAKRPQNTVLENDDCCPRWEDSLKLYLSLRD